MTMYTRSQVRANRQKWIDFLKLPDTQKGKGMLDKGNGYRCCLGHGCYALGITGTPSDCNKFIKYEEEYAFAPESFVEMVGLYTRSGRNENLVKMSYKDYKFITLVNLNDLTGATPQEIGEYLESVIEGGRNTPFKPLTCYSE